MELKEKLEITMGKGGLEGELMAAKKGNRNELREAMFAMPVGNALNRDATRDGDISIAHANA